MTPEEAKAAYGAVLNPPLRRKRARPVGCTALLLDEAGEETTEACGRPKSKRSTKFCTWHRLLRDTPAMADEATRARMAREQPEDGWLPGDVFCTSCLWYVPPFYMARGRRCLGCESMAKHGSHVERTYELETDGYTRLYRLQRGRCAVCRRRQRDRRLAVDHDHETGAVRGLLCVACNHDVLGGIGGDTSKALPVARALVLYLETPPNLGDWSPPEELWPEWRDRLAGAPARTLSQRVLGTTEPAETAVDAPF